MAASQWRHIFFSGGELRHLVRLGVPVLIAQVAQMGMAFVDNVMTGQCSALDMAAVGVACSVWNPLFLLGLGCLLPLTPLMAQHVGAREPEKAVHLLRQGMILALMLSAFFLALFYAASWHLGAFGLEPELAALSGGYLRSIMWGFPAMLIFSCVRSLTEGHVNTRPAMIIGLIGLACNVPANYVLIFGKCGLPALGAVGCGIASAICYWCMCLAMLVYAAREGEFRRMGPLFAPLWRNFRVDWPLLGRVMRLGVPSAFAMFFEVCLFALTALLLAPLGAMVVAGHQVALNYSSMIFMLPMSLSITVAIRVGWCLGARKPGAARVAARTALATGFMFAALCAVLTLCFRQEIVYVYGDTPAVVNLAVALLGYVACYQIVDAMQTIGQGVLRGYNDTRVISLVSCTAYWLIGLPLGWVLTYTDWIVPALGARGFWTAYIIALSFAMCCYSLRIRHLHRLPAGAVRIGA